VLDDQQAAWNRGDIDAFMKGYEKSPETTFIGKSIVKGYASVLANYHKRYPTPEAMGKLGILRDRRRRSSRDFLAAVREEIRRLENHSGPHQLM